jgi:uncharacterized protein (DUF302 family)
MIKPYVLAAGLIALAVLSEGALADSGLLSVESRHDVPTTTDKLVATLEAKGIALFARIDHAAGAQSVDMELPPTVLVIFGTPKVGTPLMQCGRSVGIDLPLKALIWQDSDSKVWLTYNDPAYLGERHGLKGCEGPLKTLSGALKGIVEAATQ